jgi:deoxyribodipyrimidine photolyase
LNQSNYFSAEDEIGNKKIHHMDIRDRHQNLKTRKNGPKQDLNTMNVPDIVKQLRNKCTQEGKVLRQIHGSLHITEKEVKKKNNISYKHLDRYKTQCQFQKINI